MSTDRERPRSKRPARSELRGRHCATCDLRTTHVYGACLRCERLLQTRRIGLALTVSGSATIIGGVVMAWTRGFAADPLPVVLVMGVGLLMLWPGLYGLVFRRWPEVELSDEG